MLSGRLFCGFIAAPSFLSALEEANPYTVALFLSGEEEYLTRLSIGADEWIGKYLSLPFSLSKIDPLQKHIHSLVSRLAPSLKKELPLLSLIPLAEEATDVPS